MNDPLTLWHATQDRGLTFTLIGGKLRIGGPTSALRELRDALRAHGSDLRLLTEARDAAAQIEQLLKSGALGGCQRSAADGGVPVASHHVETHSRSRLNCYRAAIIGGHWSVIASEARALVAWSRAVEAALTIIEGEVAS